MDQKLFFRLSSLLFIVGAWKDLESQDILMAHLCSAAMSGNKEADLEKNAKKPQKVKCSQFAYSGHLDYSCSARLRKGTSTV